MSFTFRTPKKLKNREADDAGDASGLPHRSAVEEGVSTAVAHSVEQPPCARPPCPSAPRSTVSSHTLAARKRLQYEAALAQARIVRDYQKTLIELEKTLVEKKLEADLAQLEDEEEGRSRVSPGSRHSVVSDWLEKCNNDTAAPAEPQPAPSRVAPLAAPPPAQPAAPRQDAPAQNALLTRLAISKDLPTFSGDPVDWLQYKEAYRESTRICDYSDAENVWRLRKSLQGEAKEAVSSLLIGSTTASDIMKILELRFGRPECIINKIAGQIHKIPNLPAAYHAEIVTFAIKIKNSVAAAKAVGSNEYLHSRELLETALKKLPPALVTQWTSYVCDRPNNRMPKFELFAEFLYNEAEKTAIAGCSFINTPAEKEEPRRSTQRVGTVLSTEETNCQFCSGSCVDLPQCAKFKRALKRDRWRCARSKNLCFRCLSPRHPNECTAALCDVDGCGQPHHKLLHWKPKGNRNAAPRRPTSSDGNRGAPAPPAAGAAEAPRAATDSAAATVAHAALSASVPDNSVSASVGVSSQCENSRVLLKVVPVTVIGPKRSVHTHALLDDGATISLIASDLTEEAGLHGKKSTLRARSAWQSGDIVCDTETVDFSIASATGDCFEVKARKMRDLNLPVQYIRAENVNEFNDISEDIKFCLCNVRPKLLIGQDHYNLLMPSVIKKSEINNCYLTQTPLGWCIHGHVREVNDRTKDSVLFIKECETDTAQISCECSDLLKKSYALDAIGISTKPRMNADDLRAIEILDKSYLCNNKWYVSLPWAKDSVSMPVGSLGTAVSRLKGVERKMSADAGYASRYQDRIQHLLHNEYARLVSQAELSDDHPNVWYLPHFGVDNPNKNKLRLVFDAAAKTSGKSLNDFLLTGPDLLQSLFGILFRFRENPYAVVGDIKDMFLRIGIVDKDQHALRFLWNGQHYCMTSLIFGACCSPFIAQYINQTKNTARFELDYPDAVSAIKSNQYMDDYIDSCPSISVANKIVRDVSFIHSQGGFEMCKWASNSPDVLAGMPTEVLNESVIRFNVESQVHTLGLLWYPGTDMLAFDLSLKRVSDDVLQMRNKPTKREMLRIIASIFDVQGFLGPFMIKAKILMQQTWKCNTKWDQEIPDNLFKHFRDWMVEFHNIKNLRVPRWYFGATKMTSARPPPPPQLQPPPPGESGARETGELQLHVFCDASPSAYGAVAYWRKTHSNGQVSTTFVASKSRVAPLKLVTIPRLELQGALLACRLAQSIKEEHRIKPSATYYWTDSTTVLHWIRNDNRNYKVFIGTSSCLPIPRIFKDRDLSLRKQWRVAQRLTDHFWSRWVREVLPVLVPRSKWQQEGRQLQVGDVVIVVDPSSPRGAWPKGVIVAVHPGPDGRVRVVDVKTQSGIVKRSAARVALVLREGECRADTGGESVDDRM